jgi:hypothetical protein
VLFTALVRLISNDQISGGQTVLVVVAVAAFPALIWVLNQISGRGAESEAVS